MLPEEAVDLEPLDGTFRVALREGGSVIGRAVVIASGVRYRRLPVARLEELEQSSVYYAATQSEAQLCRNHPVVTVGGGNSAGQAALFLSQYVSRLSLVVREHDLGESMSRYLADRIMRNPAIEVCLHSEVRELIGDEALETLVIEDTETGERRRLDAKALFVFIGAEPHTEWLKDRVALDDGGYVLTGQDAASAVTDDGRDGARRSPALLETSVPGVFAAGDVRSGSTQRVAAAVGDGAIAVRLVHQFLGGRRQLVRLAQTYVSAAAP